MLDPRDRLIVALDVSSVAEAEALVARLGGSVTFYKIGYQLGFAGGLDFARALTDTGKQVFIDMKLHDIGNTVAQGVKSAARMGANFLTVHAYPQTMHAAVDARAGTNLRILAVTVLTSYDDADLASTAIRSRISGPTHIGVAIVSGPPEQQPSQAWTAWMSASASVTSPSPGA